MVAKRIVKKKKLSSNYGSEMFEITNRSGSEAEIRSKEKGRIYQRNKSHLKRIVQELQNPIESSPAVELPMQTSLANTSTALTTTETSSTEHHDIAKDGKSPDQPTCKDTGVNTTVRRSVREVKRPEHLKNYVSKIFTEIQ